MRQKVNFYQVDGMTILAHKLKRRINGDNKSISYTVQRKRG